MTDYRNIGQDVPAEILKTVRRGQEAVVEAIKTWTDTVAAMTPSMPEVRVPFADRLPKAEEFASRLPKPEELVANAYDLAAKLLASQRKFTEDVLHATAALLPGSDDAAANGKQAPGAKAAGKNGTTGKKNGPSAD